MKKSMLLSALAFLIAGTLSAQSTKWSADRAHSKIGFEATHLVISSVDGKFTDYTVNVLSDKEDFSDSKVDVTINVKSVNTDNEDRDKHLRTDDFFNADQYPQMIFKGKTLKKVSGNAYKLTGDLTIRGVTKTVTLDANFGGIIKDPWGNTRAAFKLSGKVNRFDYGLKWNKVMEAGGVVVGDMVEIQCAVELVKQKA